jgi:hypothetical protein
MRQISPAAQAFIDQKLGSIPLNYIEVQWVKDGPWLQYGDRQLAEIPGRILDLGNLDDVVKVGQGSNSQEIAATLDDSDGSIKALLDSVDVHKRPVRVWQTFDGLAIEDAILLMSGEVNSPLIWDEGARTVSFSVVSKIEAQEVGFSYEEAESPGVPEELVGRAWPLVFGTCINVPALQIRSPRRGVLKNGVGIRDFTLEPRLNQLKRTCCPIVFTQWLLEQDTNSGWGGGSIRFVPDYRPDPDCECRKKAEIIGLEDQIAAQAPFEYGQIEILNGHQFPQNTLITLKINDGEFSGRFSGDVFTITSRRHPQWDELPIPPPKQFVCPVQEPGGNPFSGEPNNVPNAGEPICVIEEQSGGTNPVASWRYLESFPQSSFFWAEGGSEVYMKGDESIVFVANLLPSDVIRVSAYKTFPNGLRQLTTVPASLYSVRLSNFNTYTGVTEIVLPKALSLLGDGWDDQLYVTLESSVGPNTVDIMEWLIDTYSEHGVDPTSFNAVKTKIENYPMHFPLLERKNLLTVLQELAYQARCAVFLNDDTFRLLYLAEEPSPTVSITSSDILANTLTLDHGTTEELCTVAECSWKRDHAIDEQNKVILRHNVSRYGAHKKQFDYYAFAHQELVTKSATFWLVRDSNTWRRCQFSTPLHKLALETFDPVTINLSHVADVPVKGIVENAVYDSANHTISFDCWLPVRSGSRVPYDFSYPATISQQLIFPNEADRAAGFAGGHPQNFNAKAPSGHVLGEFAGIQSASLGKSNPCYGPAGSNVGGCHGDRGDKHPSDTGDQKPGVNTAGSDAAFPSKRSPTTALTDAERRAEELRRQAATQAVTNRQAAETAKNAATGGTGGGSNPNPSGDGQGAGAQSTTDKEKMQKWLENLPETPDTNCFARIQVAWCPQVKTVLMQGGGTGDKPGDQGTVATCDGGCPPNTGCSESIYTNSQAAAEAIVAKIQARSNGPATVGAPHPMSASVADPLPPDCGEASTQRIIAYGPSGAMLGKGSGSEGLI